MYDNEVGKDCKHSIPCTDTDGRALAKRHNLTIEDNSPEVVEIEHLTLVRILLAVSQPEAALMLLGRL